MIELLPLSTYAFVMSITPGPNNVLLTASGARFGYRRTLPHIVGIGAGRMVQTYATCLGFAALLRDNPGLHQALRVAGTLYLFYLAWKMLGASVKGVSEAQPLSFWEGAAFQFVNPKAWVGAVTAASVFMPTTGSVWVARLAVTLTMQVVSFPCISTWALFGVAIRGVLTDEGRRKAFNVAMALLLVVTAGIMIRSQ